MSSPVTIIPTIDNSLQQDGATENHGNYPQLETRLTAGANRKSLLAFNFSALVPAGATITVATLKLNCYTYAASRTLTVQRLLRTDWVEMQSTWNIFKTSSNWGTAGALNATTDFTTTDAATTSLTGTGWLNWDVTNQVKTAFASVGGIAHFVLSESGGADGVVNQYHAREYTTNTALRPQLYIEYTVPSLTGAAFLLRMI